MFELLNQQIRSGQREFTGEFFQKLIASDGAAVDRFGNSVSVSADGSVVVVSVYCDDDKGGDSGSVYIFTKQANGSYNQFQKLTASDGAANDSFGISTTVSADGSVVVAGTRNDDDKGYDSGSAYVFTKQVDGSYGQFQKLTASDGSAYDSFGCSVSTSADGSVIAVGAFTDDGRGNDSGSAYIFTKQTNGTYLQIQKLTASDGAAADLFGYSVSVSSDGSVVVVGSYNDDDKDTDSGSVYIFTKQTNGTYLRTQKLTASDGSASDYFGISVSISADGSAVVIGAYGDDDKGADSGSAYVFTRQADGSYSQFQKLTADDGAINDRFGRSTSVSSDGSVVVVGAYVDDNDKGADSGSVYIFTKQADGSYTQKQKLSAFDGAADDFFGYSVSVSADGSVVVIGAYGDDDKGIESGSVYIFK